MGMDGKTKSPLGYTLWHNLPDGFNYWNDHAYDKKDYKEEMNCFFYRVAKHVHEDKL